VFGVNVSRIKRDGTDISMKPGIFFAVLIMMAAAAAILFAVFRSA
jgi:hypothetical protein